MPTWVREVYDSHVMALIFNMVTGASAGNDEF